MKLLKILLQELTIFIWLLACIRADSKETTNRDKLDSLLMLIVRDSMGDFRGVDLGDERGVVEYLEKDLPVELNSKSSLIVRQDFPGINCLYVRYTFLKNGSVASITADAYMENIELGNLFAEELQSWFSRRLGHSQEFMGVFSWKTKNTDSTDYIYVELRDESEEYGYGKVNISIYQPPF